MANQNLSLMTKNGISIFPRSFEQFGKKAFEYTDAVEPKYIDQNNEMMKLVQFLSQKNFAMCQSAYTFRYGFLQKDTFSLTGC